MQIMYPAIFDQLLAFVEFSCKPPQYGQLETKHIANAKYNQVVYRLFILYLVIDEFNQDRLWLPQEAFIPAQGSIQNRSVT